MLFKNRKLYVLNFALILALLGGLFELMPVKAIAQTVTNTNDSGAGSLRQAITDAAHGDTVTFDSSLAGETITLVSTLVINKDLTIDGSALTSPIIISGVTGNDGTGNFRVFLINFEIKATLKSLTITRSNITGSDSSGGIDIYNNAILTITDCTISNNLAVNGGGIQNWYGTLVMMNSTLSNNSAITGGGIYNRGGTMTLTNVAITNNSATHSGGGIYNGGDLTVTNSTISNNSAEAYGGGIYNDHNLTLMNSTVKGNSSAQGGGIYNDIFTTMSITNSTISENSARSGGGITNSGPATITSSTLNGNSSEYGGGIYNTNTLTVTNSTLANNNASGSDNGYGGGINDSGGTLTVMNSTFSGNTATSGSGIYGNSSPTITNSILWGNTGGELSIGSISIVTYSIVQGGYAGTGNLNTDPLLGALANNGGSTQTMALGTGSPAINTGENGNCPATDQRGITRPQGGGCDIGAYEYMSPPTPTLTATPPYSYNPLYLSLTGNQTIGGIASADEDILRFDGTNWSLFFDGSDVGVGSSDLFGFSILDSNTILMSFSSTVTVNGISALPQDILRFDATSLGTNTAGTFSMYLNGIDVGLDVSAEKIDSVSLLPDGRVLISTTGNPAIAGVNGSKDEDVLAFMPTSLGNNTSGSWSMYFDGSDVGLADTSGEDVDALDVVGGKVYLSTADNFTVNGVAGTDEDVFICEAISLGDVTACTYLSALYFDGSTWGLAANDVDAFHLLTTGPLPTATPTNTPSGPTNTPTRTPTPTNTIGVPTNTPTATQTNTATATNTPSGSDLIFANGFESGNLSAWTSDTNDLGDLSVGPAAALIGTLGLRAVIDDNNTIYVTDDSPNVEPRYRIRFYFDPNSISMASNDAHYIFKGFMGTSTEVLRLEFRQSAGAYQLRAALLDDGTIWVNTNWFTISDNVHFVELDWRVATGAGANNGGLTLWIDGIQHQDLTSIDNDTRRIDRVRLGALTGVDNGTRGTYYFDAFESRRQNYIGPVITAPTATPTADNGSAHVEVYVGGALQDALDVPSHNSVRRNYAGVSNGPVRVISTNGVPMVASERFAYNNGSAWTSYSELMGLPSDQVTTTYTFPWYDNVDFNSQLRFGNVGTSNTIVTVTIAGVVQSTYNLAPNQSLHVSYSGLDNGPVKVQSSGGVPIIASLRVGDFNGSIWTSHSELMGLPQGQLSTSYVFPWYNNIDINSQLRFGNVGNTNTTVTVSVGGIVQGSYVLAPNQSQQVSYAGVNNGPIKVEGSGGVSIVASIRISYFNGSAWTHHTETMGLPSASLSTQYFFPVYDNVNHNSQLRIGNVGNTTTNVTVTIKGVLMGNYLLAPNQIFQVSYAGLNDGPVVVQSSGGVPIIASEMVSYFDGSAWTSFSELIGLPSNQLTTTYVFPWYNNVNLDTQLRFGLP